MFRFVRELAGLAKCSAGFHDIHEEDWHYGASLSSCVQQAHCRRDPSHIETREQHDWGAYEYVADGSCYQECHCQRNSEHLRSREHHERLGAQRWKPETCDLLATCHRCTKVVECGEHHEGFHWEYDAPGTCTGADRCSRCHRHAPWSTAERHVYPDKPTVPNPPCLRCGELRTPEQPGAE